MPSRFGFFRGPNSLISVGLVSAAAAVTVVAGCGSPNHTVSVDSFEQSTALPTPPFSGTGTGAGGTGTGTGTGGTGTGATPTPKPTAIPTPGASATPKPTASPTPIASPSGGGSGTVISGTLGDYYAPFAKFKSTDTFNYVFTSNNTFVPDPAGQDQPTTSQTITLSGTDLNFGPFSTPTTTSTVQITLPQSGTISVTRETEFAVDGTTITGYRYYNTTSSLDTEYGSDTVSSGQVVQSTRYDPGMQVPLTLSSGKTFTQTYTDYETPSSAPGTVGVSYSYVVSQTIGLNILSSLTVQAGTYSNVAQFNMTDSYTLPVNAQSNSLAQAISETSTINLSKYVGLVSFTDSTTTSNQTETNPTTFAIVPVVETDNVTDQLTSATISGTNYPPGKSARITRGASIVAPKKVSAGASRALAISRHIAAFKKH